MAVGVFVMAIAGIVMVVMGTAFLRDLSLDEASLTGETETVPESSGGYSLRRSAIAGGAQLSSTASSVRATFGATSGGSSGGDGATANLDADGESPDDEDVTPARMKTMLSLPTRTMASSSTKKIIASSTDGDRRPTPGRMGLVDNKPRTKRTTEQATESSITNSAAPPHTPPRLLCVFGNWTGVDTSFPEDGLCDYTFFDSLYRGRPQEADVARLGRTSAALRPFRHGTRHYRSTEVGIAVSFSGLRKAAKDMGSPRGEPYMRELYKDGIRHTGVLDFVPGAATTEAAVERLFRFLQLCRRLQDNVIPKSVVPRPSVTLGLTFFANNQRKVYASIEKHLTAGWSPSRQKIDLVVLRTHLSGRDDVNPSCTITGSSLWGRTLADYQPSMVNSLHYMEKKLKPRASESVFFMSISVAARRYVPAGSGNDTKTFELGSRCRPFDEADYAREIDSFASWLTAVGAPNDPRRFSKDLDQADMQIGIVVDSVLEQLSDVLGILLLITLYIPAFMVAVLPCSLIYFIVQKLFVRTFRQLQRLESVSRSPVFNCIAETVPGVQTIRAYAVQRGFIVLSDSLLERWVSTAFHLMAAERWLTVRLNFLGTAVTLATACLLVHGRDTFGPAAIGLTLLYALRLTDALNFLVRFTAELENSLIAVERLHEYAQTNTEAAWRVTPAPSPDWPQHGAVNFVNFSTRYRPELDLVLHNINLEVHPSEKVGLVGRTGSGKSSLTLSMFRIVEPAAGDIVIDDVAISRIGLHDLRSKLTIIPQDPVLFCGSLRLNLDPKGEHTDDQVWAALDKAHLKAFFQNKADKLNFQIEEDGQNLSVGQHQLICLARALLRNTKLLILDEATASVDPDTDALVQQTIRRDFAHCTVLTVAHRLQTILDANRIVVMRSGKIEEIGAPGDLLRNTQSAFYAMAKEAGIVGEDHSAGFERGSSRHSATT